jgi:hypothetical protein
MSVEQVEDAVLKLTLEERKQFLDWLYEHERELVGPDYIHPEVKAEVLRRLDEVNGNPGLLRPWEGTLSHARERLHEFRRQKT